MERNGQRSAQEVELRIEWALQNTKDTLDLSGCKIRTLPNTLRFLTSLKSLDLSNNELESLPSWLAELTQLSTIDLSENSLNGLPNWLGDLSRLTKLDLSDNNINFLPASMERLTRLTALTLARNSFHQLPDWLGSLKKLTVLVLNGNPLNSFPQEVGSLENLTRLDLSFCKIRNLPTCIQNLSNLVTLNANFCGLDSIPDWIGSLNNLATLNISNNRITTLPRSIASLQRLSHLDIGGSPVSTGAEYIGQINGLKSLCLSSMDLDSVPQYLNKLVNLSSLDLSGNRIKQLPQWMSGLTNLDRLYLNNNKISPEEDFTGDRLYAALPDWLGALNKLVVLDLSGNEIDALPESLASLEGLTKLAVGGNPLVNPPPEVIAGGVAAILAFLRARRDAGTTRLWRSKVLLVGQGRAGKTTLVRVLGGDIFNALEPTTEGLAVSDLTLQHPNSRHDEKLRDIAMDLSVWDFGGQEIYHATHQFFLTARSLFLVVWNPNAGYDNSRITYWLNTVTARAPDAPILLVATHGSQRPADLPLGDLRKRFPGIVGSYVVESSTSEGIKELRQAIAQIAATLPLMGGPWPANWASAAESVRSLPETHTTFQSTRELLISRNVQDEQQDELLSALTHLGDILHYPDDLRLTNTIVLQPQWLNTRIARILDSKAVAARGGTLLWDDISEEWGDIEPAMRDHFLTMMDRYDISYRVYEQNASIASIVTALLPWDKPDLDQYWLTNDAYRQREISISYRLSFIPPGIPTWFITRTRRFTVEHWRTGALLRDLETGTLALVEADPEAGTLNLSVRGGSPKRFLPILLAELSHSFGRYPGLTASRFIACPCEGSGARHCPHQHNYTHLLKALLRGDSAITCPESDKPVSLEPLLSVIGPTSAELAHIGVGEHKVQELLATLAAKLDDVEDIVSDAQANTKFIKQIAVDSVGLRCPSVFILTTVKRNFLRQRYQLNVCCESSDGWHAVDHPDAIYDVKLLRAWLRELAPDAQQIVSVAKKVAPLVSLLLAGISIDLQGTTKADVLDARKVLNRVPSHLGILDEPAGFENLHQLVKPMAFAKTDADFRILIDMFKALDSQRQRRGQRWGGLSASLDSDGNKVFLCTAHANQQAPERRSPS